MSNILVIEDNKNMREGLVQTLCQMGHDVKAASSGKMGISIFEKEPFELVITDYKMKDMNGIEVLEKIKLVDEIVDVVIITAYGTIETAVDALRKGATDFITKPFQPDEFRHRIEQIIKHRNLIKDHSRLENENLLLRLELEDKTGDRDIIGKSESMKEVFEQIAKVAPTNSSVLILGESGTGKELVARAIHQQSPRSDKAFVRVNCGALAEGVLESELFGHERGAFTGSVKQRKGRFELAQGGTIFLDEISDISPSTQVKLLRVLQEREFERVGGETTVRVDIRVIAATNRDLLNMVNEGKFREDLFYRLHIIPIYLPALRERREDILVLTKHFIEKVCAEQNLPTVGITDQVLEILESYNWPGNIRELENVIERAVVLCNGKEIEINDLPILTNAARRQTVTIAQNGDDLILNPALESLERQMLEKAMKKANGVKTRAAEMLDITPSALYYKLEKYNLNL